MLLRNHSYDSLRACRGYKFRHQGQVVGGCALEIHHGARATVWSVFIDEAHRGKGLSKRMMRQLIELARRIGLKTLSLLVFTDNPAAMRLYEGCGFRYVKKGSSLWRAELEIA